MASPELAVLAGVKSCMEDSDQNLSAADQMKSLLDAVNDIFDGLTKLNRDSDREYLKMKVTSWFLAKTLEKSCTPMIFSDKFKTELKHVPLLEWEDLFLVIYKANLVTPFVKLLAGLDDKVQCFITSNLKAWFCTYLFSVHDEKTFIPLEYADLVVFAVSTIVTGTIISTISCKNIINIMSFVQDLTLEVKQSLDRGRPAAMSPECLIAVNILEADLLKMMSSFESTGLPSFDVFKLSKFSQLAFDSSLTSKNVDQFEEMLQKKFKDIEADSSTYYELTLSENDVKPLEDCRIFLEHLVERLSNTTDASPVKSQGVDVKEIFQKIHDLFEMLVDKMCGAYSQDKVEYKDIGEYLEIIRYFKTGYKMAASDILNMIMKNPLSHNKWETAFDCLVNSSECLVCSETLLQIVDGLRSLIDEMKDSKENLSALTEVACKIQNLFWQAYCLLPSKSKIVMCKKILSNPRYVDTISEYPFKNQNKDTEDLRKFYVKKEKRLNLYFGKLINEALVTEKITADVCSIMLGSPLGTMKRLIEQIFVNAQQTSFYVELLQRIPFVCEYCIKRDGGTQFLECFDEILLEFWSKSENKLVENGLNFLYNLLESNTSDDSSIMIHNFTHELCLNTLMPSFNSLQKENDTLPEILSLKVLSCIISTKIFTTCIALHQLAVLCTCLGAYVDKSHHFWVSNQNFNVEEHELAVECLEFLISSLSGRLMDDDQNDTKPVLKWTLRSISKLQWTTQIRFISVIRLCENQKINVPGCLSEICSVPDILECSDALSYGAGTGLIAWHQCFVIDPSLCPLSSLDIDKLTAEETDMFTNGWIVTLSQVLPYSLPHEWVTLTEASKILFSSFKLSITVETTHINVLPIIDMNECYVILALVQMMSKVLALLSSKACMQWTYHSLWLHVTKSYCMVMSRAVNDSSEFVKASPNSQLFMIVQIFCRSCDLLLILCHIVPEKKVTMKYSENVFILLLDLLTTFQSIFQAALQDAESLATQSESKLDSVIELDSADSSLYEGHSGSSPIKLKQEVAEHIYIMQKSVLMLPTDNNSRALISKLKQIV